MSSSAASTSSHDLSSSEDQEMSDARSPATSESSLSLTPSQEKASTLPSATSADSPDDTTGEEGSGATGLDVDISSLSLEERKAKAQTHKAEGNSLFIAAKYDEAKAKYGEAIAYDQSVPALWSNKAACELKLEQHGLAIEDACGCHLSKASLDCY